MTKIHFLHRIQDYIRSHNQSEFTVDFLMEKLETENRREVVKALRELEAQGTGEFIAGRHGSISRFKPYDVATKLPSKPIIEPTSKITPSPISTVANNPHVTLTIDWPNANNNALVQALSVMSGNTAKLGEILLERGTISETQLNEALAQQLKDRLKS